MAETSSKALTGTTLLPAQPSPGLFRSTGMCIRCGEIQAAGPLGLCVVCAIQTRIEISQGLRELTRYLEAWAQFDAWLAEREPETAHSSSR